MEQIRNFDQLLQAALAHGRKGIAVAAPYDKNTLLAVKDALASGLAAPHLFGDVERMLPLLEQVQLDAGAVKLTDVRDTAQAIDAAIESIRSGENQILMKGTVSTGTLLKHALDRTRGLNIGRLASHLIVLQIPGLDRLLISTDGGLNIAPTLTEKADILRNAIDVARALGIETPKAACLAAVETVNPKMQATVDAACLCKMADRGAFPGAVVEGPLAMDNILSAEAARKKGIDSPVPGHADIILAPSIEVANTFSKTLNYLMHSSNAGIVMGAAAPIILPSRASDPASKYASLAMGVLLALAAVETVNPKMQATVDAACLCKMADRGAFPGAVVEGPLAMDNILSAEAARKKGIDSPVPGHADIILAPSIEVANTFSKTLNYLMHSSNAGIVMGAAAPIILPSRASDPASKYASLAMGVLLAK